MTSVADVIDSRDVSPEGGGSIKIIVEYKQRLLERVLDPVGAHCQDDLS